MACYSPSTWRSVLRAYALLQLAKEVSSLSQQQQHAGVVAPEPAKFPEECYLDNLTIDTDPNNPIDFDKMKTCGNSVLTSNSSYLGNLEVFKTDKVRESVNPSAGSDGALPVCTPFKVLSDWDDTLVESGDGPLGRIKGGDHSEPDNVGKPYGSTGTLLADLMCANFGQNAAGKNLYPHDRYLTVLTANPLDGKSSWSGKKITPVYDDIVANVSNGFPGKFNLKHKTNMHMSYEEHDEDKWAVGVLSPPSKGFVGIAAQAFQIKAANDASDDGATPFVDAKCASNNGKDPKSPDYQEGVINTCDAVPDFLKNKLQMMNIFKARQKQISPLGDTKAENFKNYQEKFPEMQGSFVFMGDDGQADLNRAAVKNLAVEVEVEEKNPATGKMEKKTQKTMAFAAIHATQPYAHVIGYKFNIGYTPAFRQIISGMMNRRFPPQKSHGYKPRFFYHTGPSNLELQLEQGGWMNATMVSDLRDEELAEYKTGDGAVNTELKKLYQQEDERREKGQGESMIMENEKAITSNFERLFDDTTTLTEHMRLEHVQALASIMSTQYCVDTKRVGTPKEVSSFTKEYPRLAQHSLEVLNAFSGSISDYWYLEWGFFQTKGSLTQRGKDVAEDMKNMSIEKFCGLSTKDFERIYGA